LFQKNYYAKNILTVQSIHMHVGNADFFFCSVSCIFIYTHVHIGSSPGTGWIGFFVISLVRLNKFLFGWSGFFCRNWFGARIFYHFSSQEVQIWKAGKSFFFKSTLELSVWFTDIAWCTFLVLSTIHRWIKPHTFASVFFFYMVFRFVPCFSKNREKIIRFFLFPPPDICWIFAYWNGFFVTWSGKYRKFLHICYLNFGSFFFIPDRNRKVERFYAFFSYACAPFFCVSVCCVFFTWVSRLGICVRVCIYYSSWFATNPNLVSCIWCICRKWKYMVYFVIWCVYNSQVVFSYILLCFFYIDTIYLVRKYFGVFQN
jgi:hypothetical protein